MKIAIVEDRPWVMESSIKEMRNIGLNVVQMVYFCNNGAQICDVEEMCNKYELDLCCVDNGNFEEELNKLYEDKEMIFLFDMDLIGDYSSHFDERINTIYAKKKRAEEGGDGRIWFYTNGPTSAVEQINLNFKNRRIPVRDFDTTKNQLIFDYDFMKKNILKQG